MVTISNSGEDAASVSALTCYFPGAEPPCPLPDAAPQDVTSFFNMTRGRGRLRDECPQLRAQHGVPALRAAATEFLFTRVSPAVQAEAERQLRAVFATAADNNGASRAVVPRNLITLQVRWGDKADEMTLLPISDYIAGVEEILRQRRMEHGSTRR